MFAKLSKEFRLLGDKRIAEHSQGFFKTGKGEYGEGDLFLGIRTPVIRKFAKTYIDLPLSETQKFVSSKYHEERLLGLIIVVNKYEKASAENLQEQLYKFYVKNFKYINNWDLVDVTCPKIVGRHLINRDRKVLYKWIRSKDLWTRRIGMMANWWFVRKGDLSEVFKMSEILLNDDHDLIHKAVGWMLREAYKKDKKQTDEFLRVHYKKMPRTMLRYAIEKHPERTRKRYLKGTV